ncbi:putative transcription factor C2H2 family [Helianthus annuus]|nr:putative transcription factor C2H2 family [Helianthus annuus]KAJ0568087.1 putative transcription factor C2H2 family [Helianthus annuus]KAJ0574499.1 putative transcription factor C2H2 family [Helianthus annuus]KAJ0738829.1 putative transcription factor C2H2 family [Helianthus annuus]KAJ0913044.1 putative transcription factor C2H2 family [Helianthus annuus]
MRLSIEVAASSSPFSYVSLRDHNRSTNNKGYINSRKNKADGEDEDSSWLPSHTDDSWLPTSSRNSTVASEDLNHQNGKNIVDDSWLPTINNSSGKYGANTSGLEDDADYSWLPSSFIDNNKNKNKQKNNNNNKNTTNNKSIIKNKNEDNNRKNNNNNNNNNNKSPQKKSRNPHWALAREVVFSCDQPNQDTEIRTKTSHSSRIKQQDSPSESTYVVESPTSGGVSSLLQRWRDLAEAKNSNKNGESSPSSTCNNSGSIGNESKNDNSPRSPPNNNNDSNSDKASRRLSCPLPSRDAKDSNPGGAEKEKIRVVDIIKKLSREEELAASHAAGHVNESLPRIRTNVHHKHVEGEHNAIKSGKVMQHMIRGREAFNNFLKQMEHHKQYELKCLVERKAVSKFPHRGRIKASLRFKILRIGAESKPETKRHRRCVSKTLESNNRLDIMDLRERFNSGVEKGATESRKPKRNDTKNTNTDETPASTAREVDLKIKTTVNMKQEQQPKIEPLTSIQSTQYTISSGKDVVHKAKFIDSSSNSVTFKDDTLYIDENKLSFYEDEGQFMSARTSYSQIEDRGFSDSEEGNDSGNKQGLESFNDWMTNGYSQTPSDLDGGESYDTNYDWISEISRPKSDWEVLRQARYQEMLHHSSGNGDIQRLLERKSVSSFLGSGLRDLIDQLMVSRIEQSHVQVEKNDVVVREKGDSRKEMGHEQSSMVDEDGDCSSRTETKCSEYSERSWRPDDAVDKSETTTTTTSPSLSPSLEHSLSSGRSHNNSTPQSPFPVTHQTIEMELIYDLRGHMEQLHQEIMELRKSIKSCVNMQVKMQHSFKQSCVAARPVQKKERNTPGLVKHNCSICHVMQVDSLLYRCGHMCTCFKCAVEMQRTSGECLVCEAPIVDVVKAFAHEN